MSKRALIVDDEPDIRELLEITLGRMDIETKAAKDVRTATELLASHEFDLCLTDMHLPDGDGIELVRRINADHPGLPVAVITAYGNMDTAIAALKAGAFDFVQKPVDLDQLRALVDTALKLSRPGRRRVESSIRLTGTIERDAARCAIRSSSSRAVRRRSTSAANPAAARNWRRG